MLFRSANLSEGDIFGEMGLFTGEPRSADVVATEETEVLEINHTAVNRFLMIIQIWWKL